MARLVLAVLVALMSAGVVSCWRGNAAGITQAELVRRTQEVFDAAATGDRAPWEKYFAPDSMYFDEKGRSMDKKALVDDQAPLPPGYSGSIKLVRAQSRIVNDTAILSYDLDETEIVFGQHMTARYHGTDTWVRRNGQWQIVAGQMLRYYEDPAPGRSDLKKDADYAGTYQLAPGTTLAVSIEDGNLFSQRAGKAKALLIPEACDIFFRKGIEGRFVFRRDQQGKVDALIDRRNNEDIVWMKTS